MYNAEKTIEEALNSIQRQSYTNLEIICIDDGSVDATLPIVKSKAKLDRRIKLHSHEHRGIVYTLNKSIELSHGKYLARMDADDISRPDRIDKQVSYMESNPDIVASGGSIETFDERGIIQTITKNCNPEALEYRLLRSWPIAHSAAIIHHAALVDNNIRYNEEFTYVEDLKLFFDLSRVGKLSNLPDILLAYRSHPDQTSIKHCKQLKKLESDLRADIYRFLCEKFLLNPENDSPREWRRKIPREHNAIWILLWYTVTHNPNLTRLKKLRLVLFTHLRLTAKPRLIFYILFKTLPVNMAQ